MRINPQRDFQVGKAQLLADVQGVILVAPGLRVFAAPCRSVPGGAFRENPYNVGLQRLREEAVGNGFLWHHEI